ncbi:hypothetical protein CH64_2013 [Yersinia rohdei]|uniref:Sema domain-containing protein n=1 Tax=Yersinia rohdei TaxID=29485 RepID=A0ABM5SEP8_YERRO|nr:hypothetical protein [Yersinia rohdei]AJJ11759.1 hypothetical protein CH64_2013 [Yersinia rohdei]EEQ03033.1 hypothetical protein yrohd0001_16500 [Yersinia rohdei ATCC 43380]MDN0094885.1 hypothetical protein [Yersinia rohdei]
MFFFNMAQAALTIQPEENDYSLILTKNNKIKEKIFLAPKCNTSRFKYAVCNYSLNDYRRFRNSEVGCAVNNNRNKSRINGVTCN